MVSTKKWTMCLLVLLLLIVLNPLEADEIYDDSWYLMTFGNERLGYMHSLSQKTMWQDKEMITTESQTEMTITRFGMPINAGMTSLFVDNLQHEPVYFKSEMTISSMKTVTEGTITGNKLEIVQNMGSHVQKHNLTLDEDTIFPSTKFKDSYKELLKPGNVKTYNIFLPDLLTVVKTVVNVVGKETITINGKQFEAIKTVSLSDATPETPTTEWVDEQGNILQFETELLGSLVRGVKTTKELALNSDKKTASVDVFLDFLIRPNQPILNPHQIKTARYELLFKKKPEGFSFVEDNRQKLLEDKKSSFIVEIRKVKLSLDDNIIIPVSNPKLNNFLSPTQFLQSDDPTIQAKAIEIIGQERDIYSAAKKINTWVYENISKKDLSVGFASASEVAKNMQGDCSEHSVLATALCRAAGIPARLCLGLMYSPTQNAFGFHMWFEIFTAQWYQMDPTFNQHEVDVTHILINRGNMDGTFLMKAASDLNTYASNLSIKLIETSY